MKDIIITTYKDGAVYTEGANLGINNENLQGKLIFEFADDFVDGTAYLEFERKYETGYIPMTKVGNTYEIEIKSSLLSEIGKINLQLRITEDSKPEGVPVFKSQVFSFEVLEAINATSTIPDEYPEWIDTANEKIKEMNNINITTERVEDGVNINVTGKDGKTTTTEVKDGTPGPQGPQGEPGAVKMQVVDTLPDTGETDTIYLLKKEKPGVQNLYDEYVYTDSGWEHIGDTSVDLSDYYTKEESDEKFTYNNPTKIYEVNPNRYVSNIAYMDKTLLSNVINNMCNDNAKYPILRVKPIDESANTNNLSYVDFIPSITVDMSVPEGSASKNYYFMTLPTCYHTGAPIALWNTELRYTYIWIYGSWSNGTFTCTNCNYTILFSQDLENIALTTNVLTKTNTTAYTPTKEYHPSTKKYVDDSIAKLDNTLYINDINMSNANVNLNSYVKELTTIINNNLDKPFNIVLKNGDEILTATYSFRTPTTTASGYARFTGVYTNTQNNYYSYCFRTFQIEYDVDSTSKKVTITGLSLINQKYIPTSESVLFKDNTSVYTPTSNYNPATKKYVDDQVGNVNTILATLTTVSEVSE